MQRQPIAEVSGKGLMFRRKGAEMIRKIRHLSLLLLLCLLLLPVRAEAAVSSVEDLAGLLSSEELSSARALAGQVSSATGWDILGVTTDDADGKSARSWAEDYYLDNTSSDNGVVCLIDMDNREIYIATSGEAIHYLTDSRIESILDTAYAKITSEDYAGTMNAMLRGVKQCYDQGVPSNHYTYNQTTGETVVYDEPKQVTFMEGIIAGIVGLLSGLTLFGGVNGNYKMKLGGYAYNFRQHSKIKLNRKQDVLVNKFVHTRHIPRPQPSSGGGHGGHSSGGGSSIHIGSGGHTFGGGGRKF